MSSAPAFPPPRGEGGPAKLVGGGRSSAPQLTVVRKRDGERPSWASLRLTPRLRRRPIRRPSAATFPARGKEDALGGRS